MYSAPVGGYEVVSQSTHTHTHHTHSPTVLNLMAGLVYSDGPLKFTERALASYVVRGVSLVTFEREISDSRDSYNTLIGPVLDGALYLPPCSCQGNHLWGDLIG